MIINKIIYSSNCDGPGNRLVVFLQGCNLNCLYCHNFETINYCNNCLSCINTCPSNALLEVNGKVQYLRENCTNCDICIYTCQYSSTPKSTKTTSEKLANHILEYKDFIDGVTFSGGECTMQAEELLSCVRILKSANLNVLLDTNGYFDLKAIKPLIEVVDGLMIDIKTVNHMQTLIGHSETNLKNVEQLIKLNKVYELRTVDLGDTESKKTIQVIKDLIINNTAIKVRINKLSTSSIHPNRLAKLDEYNKANN